MKFQYTFSSKKVSRSKCTRIHNQNNVIAKVGKLDFDLALHDEIRQCKLKPKDFKHTQCHSSQNVRQTR